MELVEGEDYVPEGLLKTSQFSPFFLVWEVFLEQLGAFPVD